MEGIAGYNIQEMRIKALIYLLVEVQLVLLVSCASPGVKKRNRPIGEASTLSALLDQGRLSPESQAYLKKQGLHTGFRKDPEKLVASLSRHLSKESSAIGRMALIEVCSITADRVERRQPGKAVAYHLTAAEAAFEVGFEKSTGSDKFLKSYNESTEEVVRILFDPEGPWDEDAVFEGPHKSYHIRIRKKGDGNIDPGFYDDIYPADYLEFVDIKFERHVSDGVGGALVGYREGTADRRKKNPFLATVGMSLPVNATLDFSRGGTDVELVFHDLMVKDSIRLGGRILPLSADRTSPFAVFYNYAPKHNVGWEGMLHPEKYADKMGLFQLEPFRTDRIPVVFVHGLMSSPRTWFATLNHLSNDPVLRERYQFLVFSYPTGFPIPYNASILRKKLKEFIQEYDPGNNYAAMRKMVIVGHSMGGLLASAQIRDSEDTFTSKFFTKPIDQIEEFSEKQKESLKELLIYKANPDLERAVFVAAPHRGSDIASKSIGKLGIALIRFPIKAIKATSIPSVEGLTDLARDLIEHRPDGIKDLEPNAPELMTVLEQSVRQGVSMHSIIGRHNPEDSVEESSDTVVPYWSSHLDKVASEKVVHAKHTTITGNYDSNEEIRRILYLHAGLPYSGAD